MDKLIPSHQLGRLSFKTVKTWMTENVHRQILVSMSLYAICIAKLSMSKRSTWSTRFVWFIYITSIDQLQIGNHFSEFFVMTKNSSDLSGHGLVISEGVLNLHWDIGCGSFGFWEVGYGATFMSIVRSHPINIGLFWDLGSFEARLKFLVIFLWATLDLAILLQYVLLLGRRGYIWSATVFWWMPHVKVELSVKVLNIVIQFTVNGLYNIIKTNNIITINTTKHIQQTNNIYISSFPRFSICPVARLSPFTTWRHSSVVGVAFQ